MRLEDILSKWNKRTCMRQESELRSVIPVLIQEKQIRSPSDLPGTAWVWCPFWVSEGDVLSCSENAAFVTLSCSKSSLPVICRSCIFPNNPERISISSGYGRRGSPTLIQINQDCIERFMISTTCFSRFFHARPLSTCKVVFWIDAPGIQFGGASTAQLLLILWAYLIKSSEVILSRKKVNCC